MTIAIDLDDVLNDLNSKWLKMYNEKYDDNLTSERITEWDMTKFVKPFCGNSIYSFLKQPNFFYSLNVQKDSIGSMEYLVNKYGSKNIYVVSAYDDNIFSLSDKYHFINSAFYFLDRNNIVFMNDKSKFKADVLIDDKLENIEKFPGKGIIFDKPWNRNTDKNYDRMLGWKDIIKFL